MASRYWPMSAGRVVTSGFGPRDDGFHWGVDFGRDGGSGGEPVYASQGGTVVYAGAASGFGGPDPAGWLVVDHPAADGGGTTVYGHIVREVELGSRVEAGQRIAHVNPDSGSNGGVPPHLHFEWHRYSWTQPGPGRLDPLTMLTDALEPPANNQDPSDMPSTTTIFGIDISHYQNGLDLAQVFAEGFEFVIAKVSEGDYYTDDSWPAFRDATLAAGKILVGYHYVRGDCDAEAQAALFVDHLGDHGIPAMLDQEANSGDIGVFRAVQAAIENRGVRVGLSYLPHWYWEGHIGSPDLTGIPPLMTSSYGNGRSGYASVIYPGDGDVGWRPYGGAEVAVFQFSDAGSVAGRTLDVDAFRGTPDQLRTLLTGEDMSFTDQDRQMLREVWTQLLGQDGQGWSQLGQNAQGKNLTPVDALGAIKADLEHH
ncbi:GH25 family lysozyme [Nocardia seriolae]|uniref:GH25 family lysozyme n=1 Tax=Nocardia seriolae TaxID=37332 RepID=UPI000BBAB9CE|nr:GH25 family lysozyme [Nocardia seriolae]MTJ63637.1 peptidoglycan DD-metalloendopeptidase family protein [Nocardia seriolae]MTJ74323.1 peptidoglycan DD-metalloendopeptidase family protein [Nocardia seriolae]MTJ88208.1 peptidoglycan DD-metalloendopeptidase family protein [Nocardia seriolae]MTK32196.1 peptidoglycan DD-metalloendopeptidase family protein [Nocardia seriolae]MTK41537.1 peptidoglycan DD-metalloendopeptidase family protein [Nocardia seriolae]